MKKLLAVLIFLPLLASAHGLVTTKTVQVGKYGVEFEYNTIGNVLAGDYTLYDVYLVHPEDLSVFSYDSSFVKIQKKDGNAVFSAELATSKNIPGYAGFSTIIYDPGTYVASAAFYSGGNLLTSADFEFQVDPAPDILGSTTQKKTSNLPLIVAGLAVIIVCGLVILRFRKK